MCSLGPGPDSCHFVISNAVQSQGSVNPHLLKPRVTMGKAERTGNRCWVSQGTDKPTPLEQSLSSFHFHESHEHQVKLQMGIQ